MFHYRMEGTEYALVDEHDRIHWAGENIAVAFTYCPEDRDISGTLHKHGSPEDVSAWAIKARRALTDAGSPDMAKEIVVVSGRIPLDELNRMISTSSYVDRWYEKKLKKED